MNENILFVTSKNSTFVPGFSRAQVRIRVPCFAIMLDTFQLAISICHISNPIYPSPLDKLALALINKFIQKPCQYSSRREVERRQTRRIMAGTPR